MTILSFKALPNQSVIRLLQKRNWKGLGEAIKQGVRGGLPFDEHRTLLEAFIQVSEHFDDESERQAQYDVFRAFLEHGFIQDLTRPTLLTLATLAGRHDFVIDLIQAGFDPQESNLKGHNAASALATRHLNLSRERFSWEQKRQDNEYSWDEESRHRLASLGLICSHGLKLDTPTFRGASPLLLAVLAKDNACVHYFLSCGASANPVSLNPHHPLYGLSPLEVGILSNNTEAVVSLLYFGADWKQESKSQAQPLALVRLAARFGSAGMMDLLAKRLGNHSTLLQEAWWDALQEGNSDTVAWFVAQGKPLNQPNKQGEYPIHVVSYGGDEKTLDVLIRLGANPDQINHEGQSCWNILKQFHPHRAYRFQMPFEEQKVVSFRRKNRLS